jgi:hypothetical protein
VLFVPEGRHEPSRVFDFGEFPVADLLQAGLAAAFAERSRAGGRIRAAASADRAYRRLHSFAAYLATLNAPPLTPAQLAPAHLDGWYLQRQGLKSASKELAVLVTSLRKVPGLSSPFTARLSERLPRRVKGKTASYSSAENQRILRAARADVRTAAARIRASAAAGCAGICDRAEPGWPGPDGRAARRLPAGRVAQDDVFGGGRSGFRRAAARRGQRDCRRGMRGPCLRTADGA